MVGVFAKTVVVVEDDEQINHVFCRQLKASGFHAVGVRSVQDALAILDMIVPDVVVLDLTLADGHGTEVLDKVKSMGYGRTQIVIVSADAFSKHHQLIDYSVDHVLLKPISPRGLSVLLHELLTKP